MLPREARATRGRPAELGRERANAGPQEVLRVVLWVTGDVRVSGDWWLRRMGVWEDETTDVLLFWGGSVETMHKPCITNVEIRRNKLSNMSTVSKCSELPMWRTATILPYK